MHKAQIITPVITVFDSQGNLDIQGNINVYQFLIEGGVDGILIMGSTGEFFSMHDSDKRHLIDAAVSFVKGRTRLLIGTSCMRADDTISLSNYALDKGADGVVIIGPYYFALTKESIESYYDNVVGKIHGPVFLYNFPERNGYDLSPDIVLNLLKKHKNIIGYKDTVTEMGHTRSLIQAVKSDYPNFEVYSGFDEFLAHNVMSGGCGSIGGLSTFMPEVLSGYVKAINEKNFELVASYQEKIDKAMELYSIGTPFIPIVKRAMVLRGIKISDISTVPFLQATKTQEEKIIKLMKSLDLEPIKN